MLVIATVTTRPFARRVATALPARSICDTSQPPKMSPWGLVSIGIAMAQSVGLVLGGLSDWAERSFGKSEFLCVRRAVTLVLYRSDHEIWDTATTHAMSVISANLSRNRQGSARRRTQLGLSRKRDHDAFGSSPPINPDRADFGTPTNSRRLDRCLPEAVWPHTIFRDCNGGRK